MGGEKDDGKGGAPNSTLAETHESHAANFRKSVQFLNVTCARNKGCVLSFAGRLARFPTWLEREIEALSRSSMAVSDSSL